MKLFLDTCIWGGAVPELRAGGHDVVWAGDGQQDLEMMRFSPSPIVSNVSW